MRKVESRMQFLGAGDASSFRIAAKNATLLKKNNLQELMNDTSFDVKSKYDKGIKLIFKSTTVVLRRMSTS